MRQKLLDSRRSLVRLKVEGESLERWVRENSLRQAPSGCEALWKNKWRPAVLLCSEKALSRGVINQRIGHLIRLFRWGVAEELVPDYWDRV